MWLAPGTRFSIGTRRTDPPLSRGLRKLADPFATVNGGEDFLASPLRADDVEDIYCKDSPVVRLSPVGANFAKFEFVFFYFILFFLTFFFKYFFLRSVYFYSFFPLLPSPRSTERQKQWQRRSTYRSGVTN